MIKFVGEIGSNHCQNEDRLIKLIETAKDIGCDAVKLEGGTEMADTVAALVKVGIPVVAHIGLTPQTATTLGGFKVQGRNLEAAQKELDSARALDQAGACSIVLECIPDLLAKKICRSLTIPEP